MKTKKRTNTDGHGRRGVELTVRQAELLLACARMWNRSHGLTPMEQLLMGAAGRRVEKAKRTADGRGLTRMKKGAR